MNDSPINERELFMQLLELEDAAEREAFLARHGRDDAALRARLESLLSAHGEAGDFLKGEPAAAAGSSADTSTVEVVLSEGPGTVIGPYRILQKIGEGGFGVVYMAEQREPVKRRVALKIIKLGMDTRQVVGRFEAERQALAMMDHPNIARVLDAGATETGRPYFVMELVKGVPITQFCDEHNLTTEERIRLFIPVCLAIQHAHQKGVIHRDIKPGNVMISLHDDEPVPKVIDFGIAKAMQQDLTDITVFTRFQEFMGTPAYMSPEQARFSGLDIDTRTDIYSLGVLLYELLTGGTPLNAAELLKSGYEELRRHVSEVDPEKPSTRFNTLAGEERTAIARQRREDPERLGRRLKGDLDWIVMKALEKNRARRYESAGAFAQDLRNFLSDRPVTAAAPGFPYLFGKFARRHRTALAFASIITFLLVAGIIATSYQAVRAARAERQAVQYLNREHRQRIAAERADRQATEARRIAEAEAALSAAVVQFLNEDIFTGAGEGVTNSGEMTVNQLFDRARARMENRFAEQPLVEAAIRHTLAVSLYTLGRYDAALEEIERAHSIREQHLGADAEDTLNSMALFAWLTHIRDYERGLSMGEEAVNAATRSLGRSHPVTLNNMSRLAWMYYERRESQDRCVELVTELIELASQQPRIEPVVLIRSLQLQGRAIKDEHREAHFREALALAEQHFGHDHPWTVNALGGLAGFIYDAGTNDEEAERLTREALTRNIQLFGSRHPNSRIFRSNLKLCYWRLERWEDALFHELKHYRSLDHQGIDLSQLRFSLERAPLAALDASTPERRLTWVASESAPTEHWIDPGFDDTDWKPATELNPANARLRGHLDVEETDRWTPVFLLPPTGDFEIRINGVPANAQPPHRDAVMQIVVADQTACDALRAGRNVIAVSARNLDPDEPGRIEVLAGPDLRGDFPTTRINPAESGALSSGGAARLSP